MKYGRGRERKREEGALWMKDGSQSVEGRRGGNGDRVNRWQLMK